MPRETTVGGAQAAGLSYKRDSYSLKKKRDDQEFAVKADALLKWQQAARDGACRLVYFDQAGFSASPSVQRGCSPIGEPHRVFHQPHCKRSVPGAFDFGANLGGTMLLGFSQGKEVNPMIILEGIGRVQAGEIEAAEFEQLTRSTSQRWGPARDSSLRAPAATPRRSVRRRSTPRPFTQCTSSDKLKPGASPSN
ncbi:hypothetical protein [Paraburkholderia sediminicola]|uniref:Transposase n=1 Tax=Paraburkholderia metrosideri TaxID=580937 RepID=A0ABW9E4V6_9BURK